MQQQTAAKTPRRRRYVRAEAPPVCAPTPAKLRLLCSLAECRFLSLPQLARLARPLDDEKAAREKSAQRHLRSLFDAGLVGVVPVRARPWRGRTPRTGPRSCTAPRPTCTFPPAAAWICWSGRV